MRLGIINKAINLIYRRGVNGFDRLVHRALVLGSKIRCIQTLRRERRIFRRFGLTPKTVWVTNITQGFGRSSTTQQNDRCYLDSIASKSVSSRGVEVNRFRLRVRNVPVSKLCLSILLDKKIEIWRWVKRAVSSWLVWYFD